ncbi:MAG: hypothetical protein EOO38_16520 [Cytophagaceae bacterium]|nr:MAG: hypothetical protein EOO38_16520 [Cytophagaceae bacterium]
MDTHAGTKPPPPSGTTASTEAVAQQAQVLDYGMVKDATTETTETTDAKDDRGKPANKAPDASLANYFVSDPSNINDLGTDFTR